MNIRLIAFDLDGTLLKQRKSCIAKDQGRAGEGRREGCASRACHRPAAPCYARGCTFSSLFSLCHRHQRRRGLRFQEERLLHEANLDRTSALTLMKYMDTLPAIYGWYQGGRGFISSPLLRADGRVRHAPWLFDSMKRAYTPTGNPEKTLLEEKSGPQKLQLYFKDLDARKKALLEIPRLFPQCAVSSSLPINIEINATDATKGHALAFSDKTSGTEDRGNPGFRRRDERYHHDPTGPAPASPWATPRQRCWLPPIGSTASNDEDGLAKVLEELGF